MKNRTTASLLYEFADGSKRYFAIAVLSSAFSIVFNFLTPQVIGLTVDTVIDSLPAGNPLLARVLDFLGGRDTLRANLLICSGLVLTCAFFSAVFNNMSRVNIAKGTELFSKSLRDTLFGHIQRLPFSWHTGRQTGDIIQRCTSDVETVRDFVSRHLIEMLRTSILLATALSLMFSMNVKMALISVSFIPLIGLYSTVFYGRISKQFLEADEAEGDLMTDIQENLTGVRVVRAFGRQAYERKKFETILDSYTDNWIDLGYTLGLYWGVGDFATGGQLLTIICSGAYFASQGEITLGEFLIFVAYTQSISWPVRSLGRTLSELSKAGVSITRIREILDSPEEEKPLDAQKPSLDEEIVFENVSFDYGGPPILRNISFNVPRGTTFGILGATGSGKSTLAYLLNRLYDPQEGRITIGGVDLRDIDSEYLRRGVGLVLQEPFLFSRTIGENIGIAIEDAADEDIRAAANTADIDESIREFREGYDTIVGERGVTLSGGQKQRIAIARTLMMGCPIMIFDDSTSAVDMETDERIRAALKENTGGATVFLISHRINTLMRADRIVVLQDGEIIQSGTHRELISQDGIYRRVYKMQSDAAMEEGIELG